jgi:predicted HicB family RNase H-like nuclease
MSDEFRVLDGEIDLERDDVRDSQGRRIDADYVDRAVADVHARRGRRPLGDDTSTAGHSPQVSFRVPEQTRRRAEERARAEGRSVSEVAREALERYLAT